MKCTQFGNKWIDYETSYYSPATNYNAVFAFDEPNVIVYDSSNSPMPTSSGAIGKPFICVDGYAWVEVTEVIDTNYRHFHLRFDGATWIEDTTTPIEFTGIKDASGNIWQLSYNGLGKYDGTSWTYYKDTNSGLPYYNRYNPNSILLVDKQNNIWIKNEDASFHSYLMKFDGTNWVVYDPNIIFGLQDYVYISSIAVNNDNNIWIGTQRYGLIKFDGVNHTIYDTLSGLPSMGVREIAVDKDGNIWVCSYIWPSTSTEVITKFDGTNWTTYPEITQYKTEEKIFITDKESNLWVKTLGKNNKKGLYKYNGTTFDEFSTSNSKLASNNIASIAIDKNGNKWFGGYDYNIGNAGLSKFDGKAWTGFDTLNFKGYSLIQSLATDQQGDIWVGTMSGLLKYDGSQWNIYDTNNSDLPGNNITSLTLDKNQHLWVGGMSSSRSRFLTKFDGNNWEHRSDFIGYAHTIVVDKNNHVWSRSATIRTDLLPSQMGALVRFGDTITKLQGYVTALAVDNNRDVWYATVSSMSFPYNTNLIKYDGTDFITYDFPSVQGEWISAISFDKNGIAWLGVNTYDGASVLRNLYSFDGTNFTSYECPNFGIVAVTSIAIDKNNNKWIGMVNSYPYSSSYNYNGYFGGVAVFNENGIDHTITSIKEQTKLKNSNIVIFPNPTQNTLHIQSSSTIEQINIYDISGRIVGADLRVCPKTTTIDVSHLANGIYLVKVKTEEGEVIRKIVKQ